jgi:hypothetical protein
MYKTKVIFCAIVFAAVVTYIYSGGPETLADNQMAKIENKVADDAVTKYQMTKRSGSPVDVCLGAMMVTAAYLQAKDEMNYAAWKKVQKADCVAAGMVGL